jgi:tRNA threonylcarbamoyladenosine biosynthesis protein TsaE
MKEYCLSFREEELGSVTAEFLKIVGSNRHFAFYGGMGVGKTTFITRLCHHLGTTDLVSSPTFAIVNEYNSKKGISVFHLDFYRIKSHEELLDIGFYDYCDPEAYIFIEWPDRAEEIIPEDFIPVYMSENEDQSRTLRFSC